MNQNTESNQPPHPQISDQPTPPGNLSRRHFVGSGALALAGLGLASSSVAAAPAPGSTQPNPIFAVPMSPEGDYLLPDLPYPYDALEPAIDAETMRLHHDIHFRSYMNGLNQALAKLKAFRAKGEYPEIAYWENQLAFHGAGYNLHVIFFAGMAPPGSTQPSDAFQAEISRAFGSFEAFKGQFSAAANAVQGSGWAILGWQPMGEKLIILQAEKHQNLTQWQVIPILAVDVWEHAYYLKYQNRRGDYVKNWWNVVDWDVTAKRLQGAKAMTAPPSA